MNLEEDIVTNEKSVKLTSMPWYEHAKEAVLGHWKTFVFYSVGGFGVFWGLIEAGSFFFPDSKFNSNTVLFLGVVLSSFGAVFRCIYDYSTVVPLGLENENKKVQKIAKLKKIYWEFGLASELLKQRIEKIDQNLDDLINNRVHVKIIKNMSTEEYIQWIETRPDNLIAMVNSANQLLVFDLIQAIHSENDKSIDLRNLVRVIDLIRDLYRNAYDFEVEGREIKIPEGFELLHEIQFEWVSIIRDGVKQMLDILNSVSLRSKSSIEPIEATIVFKEPPRIEEFITELDRLRGLLWE